MPYCRPRNSSASGTAELCRRLAQLLHCLADNINPAVADGDITTDLQRFTQSLLTQLEAEGWTFSYDAGPRLKARPPGHPQPFPRRSGS